MKILMITPEPFFEHRGTPFSVYSRLKALSKLGHSIDLLTYHLGEDVEIEGVRIYRILSVPFIRYVKIGPSLTKIPLDILLITKAFIMILRKRYDYIHTHEEAGIIGTILKKIFKIRHVYDMHSSIPEQLMNYNFTRSRFLIGLARLFERWVVNNADSVIVICQNLFDTVKGINNHVKVVLIENQPLINGKISITDEELKDLRERLYEYHFQSAVDSDGQSGMDTFMIALYTGTFEKNQGLDLLLQSIAIVKKVNRNVRFILVGGEENQIDKLKALSKDLKVEEMVIFLGKRPLKEMTAYMTVADVLLSPRIKGNNTPLKIYSYLQSGRPIVATNLYTHTQVLNGKIAILTEPTPEGFASGILKLLRDEELRRTLGIRGKEVAESRYSYDNFLSKTEEVYP